MPEHLIDQIKAGEVIERPASLLKELLENSIDANATRIDLQIIDNGLQLISITDNGYGMSFEELPYAFCRHATSKISDFADIYHLNSYGFRGEALASMASIARLTCRSIPKQKEMLGGIIEYHGGELVSHHELTSNEEFGTSIFIRDLFYNTPARLKFIKSKTSEKSSLKRIIQAFILTHPHIHFSVKWDQEDKEIYPSLATNDISSRISKILLKKNDNQNIEKFSARYEDIAVHGYFSRSSSKGNNGKGHFLFANERLFNDQQINRTVLRGLESFWPEFEIGHFVVKIDVAPDQLDVNVHPSKTQIKFFNQNLVCSLISAGIKEFIKQEKIAPGTVTKETNHNLEIKDSVTHLASYIDNQPAENKTLSNVFISLAPRYYLFKVSTTNSSYIIDASRLLAFSLSNYFAKGKIAEDSIIPLLISDPYSYDETVDQYLPNLLELGFEFDRLTPSTLVLRSIPDYCSRYNVTPIINNILKALSLHPNDFKKSISRSLSADKKLYASFIDTMAIHDLVLLSPLTELINASVAKELSNDLLEELLPHTNNYNYNE